MMNKIITLDIPTDAVSVQSIIDDDNVLYMYVQPEEFQKYEMDGRFVHYATIVGNTMRVSSKSTGKNVRPIWNIQNKKQDQS